MGVALLAFAFMPCLVPSTAARGIDHWSVPELVAESDGEVAVSGIRLVADTAGRLHLFYAHRRDTEKPWTLDYQVWQDGLWSSPVDIVLIEGREATPDLGVVVDSANVLHLVWTADAAGMWYAAVPAATAASAHSWLNKSFVGLSPRGPALAIDTTDNLYLAYIDAVTHTQIHVIRSDDGGNNWEAPSIAAEVADDRRRFSELSLSAGNEGVLNLVWTEYDASGWPPLAIWHARSENRGDDWGYPRQVAGTRYAQPAVASIGEEAHIVWQSTIGGDGTFHSASHDGGATWEAPSRYDNSGGLSGRASFAADSLGRAHYVTGRGEHAMWDGQRLSAYTDLRVEELTSIAVISIERGEIAITVGNQVHVVIETDFQQLWHMQMTLPIPALAVVRDPRPAVIEAAAGAGEVHDIVTPVPTAPVAVRYDDPPVESLEQGMAMLAPLLGAGASTFFILLVMVARRGRVRGA
jgi:hypothetical protein